MPSNHAVDVGENVKLHCTSAISHEVVTWLYNGEDVRKQCWKCSINTNYTLVINSVQLSDAGTYECAISNTIVALYELVVFGMYETMYLL